MHPFYIFLCFSRFSSKQLSLSSFPYFILLVVECWYDGFNQYSFVLIIIYRKALQGGGRNELHYLPIFGQRMITIKWRQGAANKMLVTTFWQIDDWRLRSLRKLTRTIKICNSQIYTRWHAHTHVYTLAHTCRKELKLFVFVLWWKRSFIDCFDSKAKLFKILRKLWKAAHIYVWICHRLNGKYSILITMVPNFSWMFWLRGTAIFDGTDHPMDWLNNQHGQIWSLRSWCKAHFLYSVKNRL